VWRIEELRKGKGDEKGEGGEEEGKEFFTTLFFGGGKGASEKERLGNLF
jgi:hypothetical protein